jgi:hypothetical protein
MACSRTNFFYVNKGVTIRGYFSKPQGETLIYSTVSRISAVDDELQGHVGKTPHFLSTLDGNWFMVCASRIITSTVKL